MDQYPQRRTDAWRPSQTLHQCQHCHNCNRFIGNPQIDFHNQDGHHFERANITGYKSNYHRSTIMKQPSSARETDSVKFCWPRPILQCGYGIDLTVDEKLKHISTISCHSLFFANWKTVPVVPRAALLSQNTNSSDVLHCPNRKIYFTVEATHAVFSKHFLILFFKTFFSIVVEELSIIGNAGIQSVLIMPKLLNSQTSQNDVVATQMLKLNIYLWIPNSWDSDR